MKRRERREHLAKMFPKAVAFSMSRLAQLPFDVQTAGIETWSRLKPLVVFQME